jgi:2,4-diaminopentanoate dehydrogenase
VASGKTYRVVQWATGNVGTRSLRTVIEHPEYELVGLWVSSEAKVGKDAGELCGLPDTGIKATNSVDEIVALDADCVIYMPQGVDWDAVCRLLESGKNIASRSIRPARVPASAPRPWRYRCFRCSGASIA